MGTFSILICLLYNKSTGENHEKTQKIKRKRPISRNSQDKQGRIHLARVQNQRFIPASSKKSKEKIRF